MSARPLCATSHCWSKARLSSCIATTPRSSSGGNGEGLVSSNNRELIDSLEREWRDALCAKDIARLRLLIHPKFMLIGTRTVGPFMLDREGWLDAIQKRELISIDLDVKDAVVFDAMLVGTVEARWRVSYLGRPIEDCVLLT